MSTAATNEMDMNNRKNIVERIQKKIKRSNLKPEEIQAIDKARSQVYNQTRVGGFVGAVGSFFIGRKRRFSTLFIVPFTLGGFFLGSQLGMITGIYSGMNTINKLPDQARLVNMVKEIQTEVMNAGGYTRDNDQSRPRPMTPEEKYQYKEKVLKETKNEETFGDQAQQDDDPWWVNNDNTDEYTFKNANPPPPVPANNDESLWKDDGDAYNTSSSSNDNTTTGSGSTWDRIRQDSNK